MRMVADKGLTTPVLMVNGFGRAALMIAQGRPAEGLNPFHFQHIPHLGACGKTRVVAQNRRPEPEAAEMGATKMRVLLSTVGSRRSEPMT
jgi:hypothetical protein